MKIQLVMFLWAQLFGAEQVQTLDREYLEIVSKTKKPIVMGELNGKKAYFLLDTGSDITILNARYQDHYEFKSNMPYYRAVKVTGLGSTEQSVAYAFKINLKLGSKGIRTHYYAYDLSKVMASLERKSGIEIAGIIGSDVMRSYGFQIDYTKNLVGFMDKKGQNRRTSQLAKAEF
ncbi:MAG: aspartyl protease family protein [Bacteroidota bacterium]